MQPNQRSLESEEPRGEKRERRRPFDPAELEKLPRVTDRDPPFRPWWVVE